MPKSWLKGHNNSDCHWMSELQFCHLFAQCIMWEWTGEDNAEYVKYLNLCDLYVSLNQPLLKQASLNKKKKKKCPTC